MAGIHFITLYRLPFARGDFVDPPQVEWNPEKDRALWKAISKNSRVSELNWDELATRFQVPQNFLLQQAAWLYERHYEHVRSQVNSLKSTAANAHVASGSGSRDIVVGGLAMQRTTSGGSKGVVGRAPSALSVRSRETVASRIETNSPAQPPLSRTPSTNTITQSRALIQPPNWAQPPRSGRPSFTGINPSIAKPPVTAPQAADQGSPDGSAISSSSSSSSDSELEGPAHRSQLFKRPPRFQKQRPRDLLSYDEDPDEDDPDRSDDVSLPFAQAHRLAAAEKAGSSAQRGGSEGNRPKPHQRTSQTTSTGQAPGPISEVSSSLASSTSDIPMPKTTKPGPLSPKHRAELAKLSPRRPGTVGNKEGSEGAPSMGSSFSDIDVDGSISQSALEDALLSNFHAGRLSTLSNMRSRYM